jgi:hypothetical protein
MSYPINYPTPQGANVQIFRGGGNDQYWRHDWVKPRGASFVFFTLIGAGGGGGGGYINDADPDFPTYFAGGGGASGGVTNFMCPAFLLPDVLQVAIGAGGDAGEAGSQSSGAATSGSVGQNTIVYYQQKNVAGYEIVIAYGGAGGNPGTASAVGTGGTGTTTSVVRPMLAAGFYNATEGADGADGLQLIATDGLTFLMGGNGTNANNSQVVGYYGYTAATRSGYSQLSPIPLSIAKLSTQLTAGLGSNAVSQSFGCGGNGGGTTVSASRGGKGGDGLVVIVTW